MDPKDVAAYLETCSHQRPPEPISDVPVEVFINAISRWVSMKYEGREGMLRYFVPRYKPEITLAAIRLLMLDLHYDLGDGFEEEMDMLLKEDKYTWDIAQRLWNPTEEEEE